MTCNELCIAGVDMTGAFAGGIDAMRAAGHRARCGHTAGHVRDDVAMEAPAP